MITRNVLPEVLPRVEYEAPISRGLSPILRGLRDQENRFRANEQARQS